MTLLQTEIYFEKHSGKVDRSPYTFVLIHGFLACTFSFRKLIPLLSSKYDTYALDLPGFGKSEKSDKFQYSYKNYGSLVIEFIRSLELKNVILVGHSMGGQIALHAALQSPDFITGLILIGSSGYLRRAGRGAVWLSYLPFSKLFIKWWIHRHDVKDVLKNTVYKMESIDQEMIDAYTAPTRESGFCNTLLGLLRFREGDLSSAELRGTRHPVLLIWGEEDRVVPLRIGLRLRQDLPNSTLVSLPEAAHQVMEEKPKEVYNEIEKWLLSIQE